MITNVFSGERGAEMYKSNTFSNPEDRAAWIVQSVVRNGKIRLIHSKFWRQTSHCM